MGQTSKLVRSSGSRVMVAEPVEAVNEGRDCEEGMIARDASHWSWREKSLGVMRGGGPARARVLAIWSSWMAERWGKDMRPEKYPSTMGKRGLDAGMVASCSSQSA